MRISTGVTVNVSANTERWLSEIRSGHGFGGTGTATLVAAQFGHVQLFNPAASGITVIGRLLLSSTPSAIGHSSRLYNTALTTLTGNGSNLLSGGAASVAEIRTQTNAAILGSVLTNFQLSAQSSAQLSPDWIIELGAGEGILIAGDTVNISVIASFLWIEV